jgi:DNA repair protein RadC
MNNDINEVQSLSDNDLLERLIGVRQTQKCYRGSLGEMFSDEHQPVKCLMAKELVKRWLDEELKRDCVLNSPGAVRDCLRIHFAGREYESFVAMFLDSQHRLITTLELFRGTLTQTSVYPREVVKAERKRNEQHHRADVKAGLDPVDGLFGPGIGMPPVFLVYVD